jgi:hypothetical protein
MTRPGRQRLSFNLMLAAALAGLACTGTVEGGRRSSATGPGGDGGSGGSGGSGAGGSGGSGPGGSGGSGGAGGTAQNAAGLAVFRRLTLTEFQNTIRDLLGVNMVADDLELPPDAGTDTGFGKGASFTNSVDALKFSAVTEKLAAAAVGRLAMLVPKSCNLSASDAGQQEACAKAFIESFGLRAYRRPLLASEQAELLALYKTLRGEATVTFADALGGLIDGMLQAPQFLYHWELSGPAARDGALVKFGPYELASRLSYFLWASMPDETLFAAAAGGMLQGQLEAQARRMIKHEHARDGIADFHVQWLEIAGLPGLTKDESYTKYNAAVGQAMIHETVAFAQSVLWGPTATGKLQQLFTSSDSFMNAGLANLYGVKGVTGDQMTAAKHDAKQRAGLLTHASFLASHADGDFSHPVRRGVTMLRHVLCQNIPSPDGVMVPTLPPRQMDVTTRQFYSQHSKFGPICAGCHDLIDPMGFAFEKYDAVGQFRTTEFGQTVDASGTLKLPSGDLVFDDAVQMAGQLADRPELRECVARHWLRYLLRRPELETEERGSVDDVMKIFERSGWDVRELLVGLTTTRAFTHRQPFQGEQTR